METEELLEYDYISEKEEQLRNVLNFCFRLLISSFLSYQIFDFLYSPLWMHGYVWSLNQNYDFDVNTKTAGEILEYQLRIFSIEQRIAFAVIVVFAIWIILYTSGFDQNRTVWYLLRLSILIGCIIGITRYIYMRQRLYTCIHDAFYAYLTIFMLGLTLTLRVDERFEN